MPTQGAAELMRELGLTVDGPARWGSPISSDQPGVIVVELPSGRPEAPIDAAAVRRWLEHVPTLALVGTGRPTVGQLTRALAERWNSGEAVLYVSRSPKSVGGRLAAMYGTTLGDAKPNSAGHWLKTLASPGDMRVWWAETNAHEEYEDALRDAFARANHGRLPFANNHFPNSLRADSPQVTISRTAAARATVPPKPRKRVVKDKVVPPSKMATAVLSRDGHERLTAELEELRAVKRPQIIARVKAARELGDLRENGDYEYARKEQSFVEGRIQTLEQLLRTPTVVDEPLATDAVRIGSTVEVEHDGDRFTYTIVSTAEANPALGRLSNASPVGRALVGSSAGDEVTVQSPGGALSYRVVKVG